VLPPEEKWFPFGGRILNCYESDDQKNMEYDRTWCYRFSRGILQLKRLYQFKCYDIFLHHCRNDMLYDSSTLRSGYEKILQQYFRHQKWIAIKWIPTHKKRISKWLQPS